MPYILPEEVFTQPIHHPEFEKYNLNVSIVRLDKIHPIISGNKWFKLQGYISEVHQNGFTGIATFGGAYSNHIVATAAACKKEKLDCLGFIRGEEPAIYSQTLKDAKKFGMTLCFINRTDFQSKDLISLQLKFPGYFFIKEGGYGLPGTIGIKDIYRWIGDQTQYIISACGTGTTLAGFIKVALPHQNIIGINVLKGYEAIDNDIKKLLESDFINSKWKVINDYHFGGYAKKNSELIGFMNELWKTNVLPTDFVYTAKMIYGIVDLAKNGYFPKHSIITAIHTGGLQGNQSLPKGTLLF